MRLMTPTQTSCLPRRFQGRHACRDAVYRGIPFMYSKSLTTPREAAHAEPFQLNHPSGIKGAGRSSSCSQHLLQLLGLYNTLKSWSPQSQPHHPIINLSCLGGGTSQSTDELMYDAYLKTVKLHWKQEADRIIIASPFRSFLEHYTLCTLVFAIYSACGDPPPPLQCFGPASPLDENLLV